MKKRLGACFVGLFTAWIVQAFAQETPIPQEAQTLRLVQTIQLPGVVGRLDHMALI
jgi:hypothetical protein